MNEVRYAGFWIRFLTFLIDSVVAALVIFPFVTPFIGGIDLASYDLGDPIEQNRLLRDYTARLGIEVAILAPLFILFWTYRAATPGKMLLGCLVVDAKTLGKAGLGQNIIRYLGYYVALVPLGLGFIWIAFDSRKQGWHDKLAGTVVIRGRHGDLAVHQEP